MLIRWWQHTGQLQSLEMPTSSWMILVLQLVLSDQNDFDQVKDSDDTIRQAVSMLVCLHHKDDCHCEILSPC